MVHARTHIHQLKGRHTTFRIRRYLLHSSEDHAALHVRMVESGAEHGTRTHLIQYYMYASAHLTHTHTLGRAHTHGHTDTHIHIDVGTHALAFCRDALAIACMYTHPRTCITNSPPSSPLALSAHNYYTAATPEPSWVPFSGLWRPSPLSRGLRPGI